MDWLDKTIEELCGAPCCGYHRGGPPATEPTSLAAIALANHGRWQAARQATEWLVSLQSEQGSLADGMKPGAVLGDQTTSPSHPIRRGEPSPHWQTSLAILAWIRVGATRYSKQIRAAIKWTLSRHGEPIEPTVAIGHNTQLIAWPWVAGTHSWIEPTALYVRALKAAGYGRHARTREAIEMLLDRQLPSGGCNYGNTRVLGQSLLPHIQPTGLAMLALAGESDSRQRIARSLNYLTTSLSARTTTASLCWGLLGLSAHERRPDDADLWLESAYGRTTARDRAPYKLALLALAGASAERIL